MSTLSRESASTSMAIEVGDRVKVEIPQRKTVFGILNSLRASSKNPQCVRVHIDGLANPTTLHRKFISRVAGPNGGGMRE